MDFRNYKFIRHSLSVSNFTQLLILLCFFVVTCFSNFSSSQECSTIDDCKCMFPNKTIVDISSLGFHDHTPRFLDIVKGNYSYSYNPCYKFNLGSGSVCQNVAVCQRNKQEEYNCGENARFKWNSAKGVLQIIYTAPTAPVRNTTVNLICSPATWIPTLVVDGEIKTRQYEMTLTSRCACADLCRESHLSAGSVLVILFMIFVALYLLLGIIHSSLTRGAHGWELIPHYEFWADFPLLVRDGCVFVVSGCKADTAYERI